MTDMFAPAPIIAQDDGFFFDDPDRGTVSILALQVESSDPTLPTMEQHSGMLSADRSTSERLSHFDPDLYDLSDQSHLTRFMRALIGDAGVGQLRKRYAVARLQQIASGTHFYDLDGFWGSLFGIARRPEEQLPGDPIASNYLPDEWDDIHARDGRFRERVIALSKALPLGGTVAGVRAIAEAITGVECDVFEGWQEIALSQAADKGRAWGDVMTKYPNWSDINGKQWSVIENRPSESRLVNVSRDEIWIQPKKTYDYMSGIVNSEAEDLELQADIADIVHVLGKLAPASVFVSVNPRGLASESEIRIANTFADSEFWSVVSRVTPNDALDLSTDPYVEGQPMSGFPGIVLPKPAFSQTQTMEWFYNANIKNVAGNRGVYDFSWETSREGKVFGSNFEVVSTTGDGGRPVNYWASRAIMDPVTLISSLGSKDSIIQVSPYSAPRMAVPTYA